MAGTEKRKERRIKVSIPIQVVYRGEAARGLTGNISRLGAYAEVDRELPIGAEVEVTLSIDGRGDEVNCSGSVFRSGVARETQGKTYYGLGIFFTGFHNDQDKQELSEYIGRLIAQEEREIKKGVAAWRHKRMTKNPVEPGSKDVAALLKEILSRLEEIQSLLKSRGQND